MQTFLEEFVGKNDFSSSDIGKFNFCYLFQ